MHKILRTRRPRSLPGWIKLFFFEQKIKPKANFGISWKLKTMPLYFIYLLCPDNLYKLRFHTFKCPYFCLYFSGNALLFSWRQYDVDIFDANLEYFTGVIWQFSENLTVDFLQDLSMELLFCHTGLFFSQPKQFEYATKYSFEGNL